jgi:DNA polymerase delta subunit 1
VLAKGLPIDFDYYVNKQLKQPLIRIFESVIPNPESIFSGDHTRNRYVPKVSACSALGKFIVKKATCMNCRQLINDIKNPFCLNCKDKALEIITYKTKVIVQLNTFVGTLLFIETIP